MNRDNAIHATWLQLTAAALVCMALFASCRHADNEHEVYDRMFRESRERVMFVGNEQAVDDARQMLSYAEEHNSRYGKVMAYLSLSSLAAQSADYDDMQRYLEVAHASLDFNDPPFLQGYAYFVDGTVDYSTTRSLNSLICYDKALHWFRPLGDSLMIASCYINKFNCYATNGNIDAAADCIDSAARWAPASFMYTIRLHQAMVHTYSGHDSTALQVYASLRADALNDSMGAIYPSRTSARFWTLFYTNYVLTILATGDNVGAAQICDEMGSVALRYGNSFDIACHRLAQAWLKESEGHADSSLAICSDIYNTYDGDHEQLMKRLVLSQMTVCCTLLGDHRRALECHDLLDANNAGRMVDSRLLEEIISRQQSYEQQINTLEVRTAHARVWTILAVLLLVVTIGIFYIYRKNRLLAERQARVRELENERLVAQQQSQLDTARMEQAATREQMVSFADDVKRVAYDMPKNMRARLLQGISRIEEHRGQDQWDEFEQSFNRQYDGFVERLRQKSSELSAVEMKICMLVRIGMSNRNISDTLHLADNTVRTYRTRLRRKLGVGENEDLGAFLESV